jgi:hypothetical protein
MTENIFLEVEFRGERVQIASSPEPVRLKNVFHGSILQKKIFKWTYCLVPHHLVLESVLEPAAMAPNSLAP